MSENNDVCKMSYEDSLNLFLADRYFFTSKDGQDLEKIFLKRAVLEELIIVDKDNNKELPLTDELVSMAFLAIRKAENNDVPNPLDAFCAMLLMPFLEDCCVTSGKPYMKALYSYASSLVKNFPGLLDFVDSLEV
jgi:hypothetical protein